MMRTIAVVLLMLAVTAGTAAADMYKCRRADGTIYFTDKPVTDLDDCRTERMEELPPLGVLPAPVVPEMAQPAAATRETGKPFEVYRSEAGHLVAQFEDARRQSLRASYQIDKQSARRELTAIRERKAALLRDVELSSLASSEKAEIREVLLGITE